jgi:hypothetical protein
MEVLSRYGGNSMDGKKKDKIKVVRMNIKHSNPHSIYRVKCNSSPRVGLFLFSITSMEVITFHGDNQV